MTRPFPFWRPMQLPTSWTNSASPLSSSPERLALSPTTSGRGKPVLTEATAVGKVSAFSPTTHALVLVTNGKVALLETAL